MRPTNASHVCSGMTPHAYRYEYAVNELRLVFMYASLLIAFLCMACACTLVHISVLSRWPRYFRGRGTHAMVHISGMLVHATHPSPSFPARLCATVRMYLSPSSVRCTCASHSLRSSSDHLLLSSSWPYSSTWACLVLRPTPVTTENCPKRLTARTAAGSVRVYLLLSSQKPSVANLARPTWNTYSSSAASPASQTW